LSARKPLGERAFADRAHRALRQGSRRHALKIRTRPSPLEALADALLDTPVTEARIC
jgi:hypothetical protein